MKNTYACFTGTRLFQRTFGVTAAIALSVLGATSSVAVENAAAADTHRSDDTETATDRVGSAEATTPPQLETASEEVEAESIFDKIWGYAKLYDNDENNVIQSFAFTGRFQLDYATVNADQGHHEEWNVRRFRVGGKALFFHQFIAHVEVDLNPQEGETYQRLTDAYIAWDPDRDYKITLGKHSAPFTMDGQTSSKKLLTIDRSNLANNIWFTEEYIPGVSLSGDPGHWVYQIGAYASSAKDNEFGNVSGGIFGLGTVGYNFNEALHVKEALLRVNYVYNAPEGGTSNFSNRPLQQIGSVNFSFETGCWGVRTDLSGGQGYGTASDVWGAMLMPWINLSEHFQVVTRYTFVRSIDPNGVRLARYENQLVNGRGDEYHEWYLGLNWFLYGHKLKLQTGVDYAWMADRANDGGAYRGWAWTTGLRLSW